VERDAVSPLLSVLLNSRFGYEPRSDFLTNPYANGLIKALLDADPRTLAALEKPRKDGRPSDALARAEQAIRSWAADNAKEGEEQAELIDLALFPWA
jgi:hypothetical protein